MPFEVSVPLLQLIAYSTLTLASVMVASIALYLAYWQHVGGRPIVLVFSMGLRVTGEKRDRVSVVMSFEVWNLRKYPIVIRKMTARFPGIPVDRESMVQEKWSAWEDAIRYGDDVTLGPTAQQVFSVEVPFQMDVYDKKVNPDLKLSVVYFDPRLNKYRAVQQTLPIEGWRPRSPST